MGARYWPLGKGRIVTSPFGPRDGGWHTGTDFGKNGGSGGMPVYAIQSGEVIYSGAAQGYGGPDPCGWLVIQSSDAEGGGCLEYGHIRRLPNIRVGSRVVAGQQIAVVNPDSATNGGTAPHLHVSDMPHVYDPGAKQDVMPRLRGALEPEATLVKNVAKESPMRPDFNEYSNWSSNCQNRNGTKIDLFVLHTQEGDGNADQLARFIRSTEGGPNPVSYHYVISQDYRDNGVTVVDVCDTDLASWSVGNSNNRAINLCFAGSRASWSMEQWMKQSRAIDVAAYLAVQDAKKYGFPAKVVAPNQPPPGIADHNYCGQYLKDGNNHRDVGANFPWAYFAERVAFWNGEKVPAPTPAPVPVGPARPVGPANDQVTLRWNCLGGQTLVEAVAEIRDHLLGTNDRSKTGAK